MDAPRLALREIEPLDLSPYREDPLTLHNGEKSPLKSAASMEATITDRTPTVREEAEMPTATFDRDSSPPLASPSLALDAIPQLDRSVSTASSMSSRRSSSSRQSDSGSAAAKRRGYMRPQGTDYSESAKSRESVMSLGSIAHLQYYFARTGLLDGKGAQVARPEMLKRKSSNIGSQAGSRAVSMNAADGQAYTEGGLLSPGLTAESCAISDSGLVDSPIDQDGDHVDWETDTMLPPTVSTYNQKPIYVPPPPDLTMLRRELTEALEDALKVLKESDKAPADSQGWYEIQGLHLLDIITLAIRAARNYYTAHTKPQRLYAFKSEREIRNDLYRTLEILKRMAARYFAGGIRQAEKVDILTWIVGISELIQSEIDQEKQEQEEREKFRWRTGDWTGKEREREELFLRSFMDKPEEMPAWNDPGDDSELPTHYLQYFQNGLRLVKLHNELVRRSKRHFEEIKTWHTDTAKPYRMAENLRYWVKASQLRWDVKLDLDVMAVVHGTDPAAWRQFDTAILRWCKGVREELSAEMDQAEKTSPKNRTPPTLRIQSTGTPEREARSRQSSRKATPVEY